MLEAAPQWGEKPQAAFVGLQEEAEFSEMKSANGRFRVGESFGEGPVGWGKGFQRNGLFMFKVADFLVGEIAPICPGEDVMVVECDGSAGAGIAPGADGGAMKCCEMRAAAEQAAEIAGEGAHVIAAADGDS